VAVSAFTQNDIDNNRVVYVHDGSETTSDSFLFTVDDGQGTATSSAFNIGVTPANDEESLDVNAGLTLNEGATATIDGSLLSTSDPDNSPVQLTYTVTSAPANGRLELTTNTGVAVSAFTQNDIDNDRLVYVHDGSETTSDSFLFTVDDGQGSATSSTFNISVTPVNDEQSIAVNAGLTLNEGAAATIDGSQLSTSDPDNSPVQLAYTVTSAPANGRLELTANPGVAVSAFTQNDIDSNRLVYVHDGSETTSDSFLFTVDDGQGTATSSAFNISVMPVNDAPVAVNDAYEIFGRTLLVPRSDGVLKNDSDVEGSPIFARLVGAPRNGTLMLSNDGSFIYVPSSGFFGTDVFTYRSWDGSAASNIATVVIQVPKPPEPPGPGTDPPTDPPPDPPSDPPTIEDPNGNGPGIPNSNDVASDDPSSRTLLTEGNRREPPSGDNEEVDAEIRQPATEVNDTNDNRIAWADFSRIHFGEILTNGLGQTPTETVTREVVTNITEFATWLWTDLDQVSQQMSEDAEIPVIIAGGSTALATSISVGYVFWLIRGGQLFAAMMAQLPAWRLIDPLPILAILDQDEEPDDESLEDIVDEADRCAKDQHGDEVHETSISSNGDLLGPESTERNA
jgi:hypothetical protein